MKIIAVDNDREALQQLEASLKEVYAATEVLSFQNPMLAIQRCAGNKEEAWLLFAAVLMKPLDGFELTDTLRKYAPQVSAVYTTRTDNAELAALAALHGRHLVKPITREKVWALAKATQEACLEFFDENSAELCVGCHYYWCERRGGDPPESKTAINNMKYRSRYA